MIIIVYFIPRSTAVHWPHWTDGTDGGIFVTPRHVHILVEHIR